MQIRVFLIFLVFFSYATAETKYTFEWNMQNAAPELIINIKFDGNRQGISYLQLPNEFGGNSNLYDLIDSVQIKSANTVIKSTKRAYVKQITYRPGQTVEFSYRVKTVNSQFKYPIYQPHILKDYFYFLGPTALIVELSNVDTMLPISLEWIIPADWEFANSFGDKYTESASYMLNGGQYKSISQVAYTTKKKFLNSIFSAGRSSPDNFRKTVYKLDSGTIDIAIQGKWQFTDNELNEKIIHIIKEERSFFNQVSGPYFLIFIHPVKEYMDSLGGLKINNAFVLGLPRKAELNKKLLGLIAHEYFHTWNNSDILRDKKSIGNYQWFTEGFTDYYMNLFLLRTGLITLPDYVELLNATLAEYYTSPVLLMNNTAVKGRFWEDLDVQKLPYQRGAIMAHNWNAVIRTRYANKQSLDNFMRSVVFGNHTTDGMDFTNINKKLQDLVSAHDFSQDIEMIKTGAIIEPMANIMGPCVTAGEKMISRFNLGFDLKISIVTGKIKNLDNMSPAYKQGIREGDGVINIERMAENKITYFMITVKQADGQVRKFKIQPESGKPIAVPQFIVDKYLYELDKEHCLKWYEPT